MSKQAIKPTDSEIDALLAEIEGTLNQAQMLAKSSKLAKDEDSDSEKPEAEAPAPAEAPAEAPAPEAPAPEAEAQGQEAAPAPEAPEAPAPEAEGSEQPLEEEQEAPLSDEELDQIYGAMDPEELERHFMIIRQHMQSAVAKMEEKESDEEEKKEAKEEPKEEKKEDMEKSEKIAALEHKLAESDKKMEVVAKALEFLASRPTRKAVTGIEYVQKSQAEDKAPLSEAEIKEKVRQFKPSELSKSEREAVNGFLLYGEQKSEILRLIDTKGGK